MTRTRRRRWRPRWRGLWAPAGLGIALTGATLGVVPGSAHAQDILSGSISLETRAFPQDPVHPGQAGNRASIAAQPELFLEWDDGRQSLVFSPFVRLDSEDAERTHLDARELYWRWLGDRWELRAGLGKVFWGVAESQHLVDVINQTDLVEAPDGEDKLGQPMVQVTVPTSSGALDFFLLPGFRERTFPGEEGRLRAPLAVDGDASEVERRLGFAARWSHYFGPFDLAIAHFRGTSRDPLLKLSQSDADQSGAVSARLVPRYPAINQTSVEAQATVGSWLIKLEALSRGGLGDRYVAAVSGFEYTWANMRSTGWDLGLLAEYHYDGRKRLEVGDLRRSVTPFDDDLFFGARLALNDVQSSELLGGAIVDLNGQGTALFIEASRRVGDRWSVDLELRSFLDIAEEDLLYSFRRDTYGQLSLGWYF